MTHTQKFASLATAAMMAASMLINPVFAQDTLTPGDLGLNTIQKEAGFGKSNIYQTVGQIIRIILSLLGIVAIVLVIYGGFKWMTAGGSEEKVEEAKKILLSGAIGMVIILSAYALSSFVLGSLLKVTGASGFSGV